MEKTKNIKDQFDALYAKWEKVIQDPKIQVSSKPEDYIDNEPYREIVKLGKDTLPFILEKIEQGVFFMNQAALEVAGIRLDQIIVEEEDKLSKEKVDFLAEKIAEFLEELPKEKVDFLAEKIPEFPSEQQKSKFILKHIRGK